MRDHGVMARYLDFLVAFDEYLDRNDLDYLIYGHEMFGISESAGLTARADQSPARWTGQLVEGGYIQHGPLGYGDRRPLIPPSYLPEDLSRVSDYRMTATGRTEADRVRRQRRDAMTDASLGGELPEFVVAALSDVQRLAVAGPLTHLRSALDNEHPVAAVGAAKDLVEAACKVVIAAAGQAPSGGDVAEVANVWILTGLPLPTPADPFWPSNSVGPSGTMVSGTSHNATVNTRCPHPYLPMVSLKSFVDDVVECRRRGLWVDPEATDVQPVIVDAEEGSTLDTSLVAFAQQIDLAA